MPDIFLSYSREDQVTARRFAEAFGRAGRSVWWDQALNPGEAFDDVTERALEEARVVVVLWSKASVGSRWVRAEATQAHSSDKLVPVMIEPCKRPIMFELTHTVDLSAWKGDDRDPAWQSFLVAVGRFAGKAPPQAPLAMPPQLPSPRGLPWALAALGMVLLLGIGGWWLKHSREAAPPINASTAAVPEAVAQERRLLVLPFTNISGDRSKDYFASGLTEELLTQLQQIQALTVLGRETSTFFQGKAVDPAEIRARFNVQYLLSGSVRVDGDRVKINPSLADTDTGRQLWTKSYEGQLKDVWSLQEQIATEVARELSITLDVGDLPRAEGGTTNVEAYDRYLMALDQRARGDTSESVRLLKEAVKLDPDFARASMTLSIYLAPLANHSGGAAAAALTRERFEIITALKARNLGGAMGLEIRSIHAWWTRDWKTAVDSGQAAMAQSQNSRRVAFMSLVVVGRLSEAIPIGNLIMTDNPLETEFSRFQGMALGLAGRSSELQAMLGSAGEQDYVALLELIANGSAGEAQNVAQLRAFLEKPRLSQEWPLLHSKPDVALEDIDGMRRKLAGMLNDPAYQDEGDLLQIAQLARFYGDNDLAFSALRKDLIDLKFPWPFAVWQFPLLRGDPRFKQLVTDMGLVDYWRSSGNWGDFCKPAGKDDFECR